MSSLTTLPRAVAVLFLLIFVAVVIRTAWISDDALITLRTVLNVTHGYGLVYNITERVQTFTHPLWVLPLTIGYLITRHLYYATFLVSIATSSVVFWLAVRHAASRAQAVFIAVALVCSRAFVDFSTSGLENPLSHLLLGLFVLVLIGDATNPRRRLTRLWLLASLLYLTRPDDVVIVLPVLLFATWQTGALRASVRPVIIGLSPAIAWTVFAIVYYGVPFPNTAYAKIATGIPKREIFSQGLVYIFDSFDRDPMTGITVAFGVLLGLAARGPARLLAAGLILHLLYVVSIGGDFMAGRFISVALFGAVLIAGWMSTRGAGVWVTSALAIGIVAVTTGGMPLMSDSRFDNAEIRPNGIVDERALYMRTRSLLHATRSNMTSPVWPRYAGPPPDMNVLETCGLLGAGGVDWGPRTHMLDECALADPLLSRLPAVFNTKWRIGHFRRMLPEGYHDSLAALNDQLTDPALRTLYEDIRLVTRSTALLSTRRMAAIWRLNTGVSARDIDRHFYRHAGSVMPIEQLAAVIPDGTPFDGAGVHVLDKPLAITLEDKPGRRFLDVTLDSNDRYHLFFLKRGRSVGELDIGPIPPHRRQPGLATRAEDVPVEAREAGFDTIVVTPVAGDEQVGIGHLLIDGFAPTQAELDRRVAARMAAVR